MFVLVELIVIGNCKFLKPKHGATTYSRAQRRFRGMVKRAISSGNPSPIAKRTREMGGRAAAKAEEQLLRQKNSY